ncbi:MAG TPA: type IV secretory system conjugative DNA transfer family protein [Tenuifilaceae bacterium]|nr:type IV secretory system conjugative DNA transfer family protein [Tenuifilaceae bacterium]
MNLTTFVFLIFANVFLSTLTLVVIGQLKGKIIVQTIVVLFIYAVFAIFLGYIWDFDFMLFIMAYVLPSFGLSAIILFTKRVILKPNIKEFTFIYETDKGLLLIHDIFIGLLGLGGAGAGKTKSITKPTIKNMARLNFSGIIYDYKKFDLSKCAFTQYSNHRSTVDLKFVNFFDLRYSNLINPIHPDLLPNQAYAQQAALTLIKNLMKDADSAKDPFFIPTATAGFAGLIWRLREDYPKYCTLPHAVAIFTNLEYERIARFIRVNKNSNMIGASFVQSADSPRTAANVQATLSNALSRLAIPEVFEVLKDSDFSLKLNDPTKPTLLCISNEQSLDEVYSPIIATIIAMALKHMNSEGRHHAALMADEGMTLKIPNLDNTPATMREYKLSTMILTQDLTQAEDVYGRIGMDKIVANLGNQLYGRVRDPKTAKRYSEMFGKYDKEYVSYTRRSFESGSHTVSTRETDRYAPQVFTKLKSGEFIGVFGNANKDEFHGRFKMYDEPEQMIPMIRPYITQREIIQSYEKIIQEAEDVILRDEAFVSPEKKGF